MSEREESEDQADSFSPPSPYDEPTGSFRRPEMSAADRDAFYERHRRRPGPLSRVESLDDLAPDEVETRPLNVPPAGNARPKTSAGNPGPKTSAGNPGPKPPGTSTARNPVPMPPVNPAGGATRAEGPSAGPSAADTAPTERIDVPDTGADEPTASDQTQKLGTTPSSPAPSSPKPSSPEPVTPIPDVHEMFPELAAQSRSDEEPASTATRVFEHDEFDEAAGIDHPTSIPTAPVPLGDGDGDPDALPSDITPSEAPVDDAPAPRASEPRGSLDAGLLLLRLGIGVAALAHGLQKLFGIWGGPGLDGFSGYLANSANPAIGFHSNATHILAIVGAVTETVGGALIIVGLCTPVAACAVMSVMLLATTFKVTLAGGFSYFAGAGGVEYEVLLAVAAAALVLTGPGLYSLDRPRKWARRPFVGSVLWLMVGIAAACAVWVLLNGANPLASPAHPG